jgi:hypothetical protein
MIPQEQHLQHILDLKRENPEMEIHFCIDSDFINDYGWTDHQIVDVNIMPWYRVGERISTDKNLIIEMMYEGIPNEISDEDADAIVTRKYEKEVKQVICVFTIAVDEE